MMTQVSKICFGMSSDQNCAGCMGSNCHMRMKLIFHPLLTALCRLNIRAVFGDRSSPPATVPVTRRIS